MYLYLYCISICILTNIFIFVLFLYLYCICTSMLTNVFVFVLYLYLCVDKCIELAIKWQSRKEEASCFPRVQRWICIFCILLYLYCIVLYCIVLYLYCATLDLHPTLFFSHLTFLNIESRIILKQARKCKIISSKAQQK